MRPARSCSRARLSPPAEECILPTACGCIGWHLDTMSGRQEALVRCRSVDNVGEGLATVCRLGPDWLPRRNNRLIRIRLEENDVLVMPPGVRVIHAVYTAQTSLLTGGMVWDFRNILQTLEHVLWTLQNIHATNEDMPLQLPTILTELESWTAEYPPRFCSPEEHQTFVKQTKHLIERYRDLKCNCGDCAQSASCSCREARRRCTVWCHQDGLHPHQAEHSDQQHLDQQPSDRHQHPPCYFGWPAEEGPRDDSRTLPASRKRIFQRKADTHHRGTTKRSRTKSATCIVLFNSSISRQQLVSEIAREETDRYSVHCTRQLGSDR